MIQWIVLVFAICANASANIFIKAGMAKVAKIEGSMLHKSITQPFIWAGALCFGLALLAYAWCLSKMELSVAYPIMTSVGLIIVALVSYLLFQEQFTNLKIIGTLLIVIGVVLVAS